MFFLATKQSVVRLIMF